MLLQLANHANCIADQRRGEHTMAPSSGYRPPEGTPPEARPAEGLQLNWPIAVMYCNQQITQ